MRKRICILLLAMLLALTCIPALSAQAAQPPDYDRKSEIRAAVSKAVLAHASKLQQPNAHLDALTDMAYHTMLKNGATLHLSDKSSTAAAMFNALMFQEALAEGITSAVVLAQDLNQSVLFSNGIVSWHVYGDTYAFNGYLSDKKEPGKYIPQHTSSQAIYGGHYPGAQNQNDTAMQLIAGGMATDFLLTRSAVKSGTMVYEVKLYVHDVFDFDTTYSYQANKGYDVTMDELLVKLGRMLNLMGGDNFAWDYTTTFTIEVPYACDHTNGSYQWVYDASSQQIHSIAADGFQHNPTVPMEYITSNAEVRRYYKLSKPVNLYHNKPWVIEYDTADANSLVLSATESPVSLPYLVQSGRSYTWIGEYIYDKLETDREGYTTQSYARHYTGVKVSGQFKYVKNHIYTYRLENRVEGNGSNMIWLSVYDKTTGQLVMEPTPMDEYQILNQGESERTLVSENSTRLSGKDLTINYIGNRWNTFKKTSLTLRIWENGQETAKASAMITSYQAPTCTGDGGYTSKCPLCDYSTTKKEAAKGHSFGAWSSNADATCEVDGTVSASCMVCGVRETRKDPGTAKGHSPQTLPGKDPTCTEAGLTQGSKCITCQKVLTAQTTLSATGHSWLDATCQKPQTCRICAASEGDVAHKPITLAAVAPTCTAAGLTEGIGCESCGMILTAQNSIPATGHSWRDATCEEAKTCAACKSTEGEPLGHSEQILAAIAPTCTQEGRTEGKQCDRCNKTLAQQQTVPATGHNWLDATCAAPKTCQVCAETEGELLPHAQIPLASVDPTCTEAGLTEGIGCERCGAALQAQQTVPATGHNWLDATCQKPQTCTVCAQTQGDALAHQAVTEDASTPGCETPGSTGTTRCTVCGTVLAEAQPIAPTGHKDADGDQICDLCGLRLKTPISPIAVAAMIGGIAALIAAATVIVLRRRKRA